MGPTRFSPVLVTGAVVGVDPATGIRRPYGTAFALRRGDVFCTAAHVLPPDFSDAFVIVGTPTYSAALRVTGTVAHESADLGVIHTGEGHFFERQPIKGAVDDPIIEAERSILSFRDDVRFADTCLGYDFVAYGYPTELASPDVEATVAVPRVFKGHVQRFLRYVDGRSTYLAAEMSCPAPGGLSGAPLFDPVEKDRVFAVVTKNAEATLFVDKVEDVTTDGARVVERTSRLWTHGIALVLSEYHEWLGEVIDVG